MKKIFLSTCLVIILATVMVAPAWASTVYIVKAGDTIFSIALRFGVSQAALMHANGLTSPLIFVGTPLVIPGPVATTTTTPSTDLGSTASTGDLSAPTASTCGTAYVVQPGDTLSLIAEACSVSTLSLQAANGIANADLIFAGQSLRMPSATASGTGGGSVSAPTTSSSASVSVAGGRACGPVYVVQVGDMLGAIAARCGTTWQTLMAINHLSSSEILFVGQELLIPSLGTSTVLASGGPYSVYSVQAGDTFESVAARYKITVKELLAANGLNFNSKIYFGERLIIPSGTPPVVAANCERVYTVQLGDTLSSIAARCNVDARELIRINRITNVQKILVGDLLILPGYTN